MAQAAVTLLSQQRGAIVAVTDTAGRLTHTARPTRSHAIELAIGQLTPRYGDFDNTREAGTTSARGGCGAAPTAGEPDP